MKPTHFIFSKTFFEISFTLNKEVRELKRKLKNTERIHQKVNDELTKTALNAKEKAQQSMKIKEQEFQVSLLKKYQDATGSNPGIFNTI